MKVVDCWDTVMKKRRFDKSMYEVLYVDVHDFGKSCNREVSIKRWNGQDVVQ